MPVLSKKPLSKSALCQIYDSKSSPGLVKDLREVQNRVITCKRCPRLVQYISNIREKYPPYWCRPVPGFGDPLARILLLGLAPGRFGSNRTGRMFTGDASGKFLFDALYQLKLASQSEATSLSDQLKINDIFIMAIVRCAPPQNKPRPDEIKRCISFLKEEIKLLPRLRVIVALGQIAHNTYLKMVKKPLSPYPFRHGSIYHWPGEIILVDTYHPSRQNTQTGRLTMKMFLQALEKAKKMAQIQRH